MYTIRKGEHEKLICGLGLKCQHIRELKGLESFTWSQIGQSLQHRRHLMSPRILQQFFGEMTDPKKSFSDS